MNYFVKLIFVFGVVDAVPLGNTDPRIVGGSNATILEAPWQATIHYYPVNICGGAIVSKYVVISAGHCFSRYGIHPTAYRIRVGNTKRSVGGQIYNVKKIIVHPDFNVEHYNADIAIIRLASDIFFYDQAKPIALPDQNETLPFGKFGMVTGWGIVKHNGEFPVRLRKVYLPIVEQKTCKAIYKGIREITNKMFCAGTFDGKRDTCNGDSGGPFVINQKLFGIVSWGIECALPQFPGVFTSVPSLRSWIEENMY